MSPDLINGLFELMGAVFICLNIARLVKDRCLNGIHWLSTTYFTSWGFWNLYYYPSLGQRWSFLGGALLVTANAIWLLLVAFYALDNAKPPVLGQWDPDAC